ncbi:MAG TPA: acetolactate decarboxylase [Ohtaekwangia sp.]|nr:acetolactate decarboxylase [Ohtaekwangia sp.]
MSKPTLRKNIRLFIFVGLIVSVNTMAQTHVKVAGAMRNVMRKGEIFGIINLDTIRNKTGLYGLGPVEYLAGELLIIDGRSYRSKVRNASSMVVEETYQTKAPFFVYANAVAWDEHMLPVEIKTIQQLERYMDSLTVNKKRPFVFKLSGPIVHAKIHLQNLPEGTEINSPEDAHRWKVNYEIKDREVDIVGFFSSAHQGIFTHHDSFLHMHMITKERDQMGHLDEIIFQKGIKLYLPIE